MTRRCSHCSNNGHNSRTCPSTKGVKLFGVRMITDHNPHGGGGGGGGGGGMKKSASMGSLTHYHSSHNSTSSPSSDHLSVAAEPGYASDDPASCSSNCRGGASAAVSDRKKGTPWTEEEHRLFLLGLQKLGKGDWRGIARNYVISRTPTQVASHAQKYFIRQSNSTRRKRRSSLFDMVPNTSMDQQQSFPGEPSAPSQMIEDKNVSQLGTLTLSLDRNFEPVESTSQSIPTVVEEMMPCSDTAPVDPAFAPTYQPILFPFIPSNISIREDVDMETAHHEVIKPTPVLPKEPVNVDELVCMSKLSIGPSGADRIEPSSLSLKLTGSSRQSAFHASQPVGRSDLSKMDGNAIPAV